MKTTELFDLFDKAPTIRLFAPEVRRTGREGEGSAAGGLGRLLIGAAVFLGLMAAVITLVGLAV